MNSKFKVTTRDAERILALLKARQHDAFVIRRRERNVDGPWEPFNKELFWFAMLGCLITTQQRSTAGTPVNRFLSLTPFPLSLSCCKTDIEHTIARVLNAFGGIRMAPTISKRAALNYKWLESGGWSAVEQMYRSLAEQRDRRPQPDDMKLEREAARFAAANLEGIGPKQSRNLWQWVGLTRYEIPLDSRVTDWINRNLSVEVDSSKLGMLPYCETVLDYVQGVCGQAGVLPCVFDAAAFDLGEEDPGAIAAGASVG